MVGPFFGFGWDCFRFYGILLGPYWFKLLGFALVWPIFGIVVGLFRLLWGLFSM